MGCYTFIFSLNLTNSSQSLSYAVTFSLSSSIPLIHSYSVSFSVSHSLTLSHKHLLSFTHHLQFSFYYTHSFFSVMHCYKTESLSKDGILAHSFFLNLCLTYLPFSELTVTLLYSSLNWLDTDRYAHLLDLFERHLV